MSEQLTYGERKSAGQQRRKGDTAAGYRAREQCCDRQDAGEDEDCILRQQPSDFAAGSA